MGEESSVGSVELGTLTGALMELLGVFFPLVAATCLSHVLDGRLCNRFGVTGACLG